ncbi:MAG: hypothetical protein APF76_12910 [Desulfitibacter sp. BRH_c19]|nr:MAG: hypothetical protein APF76_12910 [Desulfitibacter sp. BRH_c19]
MVIVKIIFKDKDNKEIVGFQIEGHAHFSQKGQDIVCSAVSVLAQTTIIGLGKYLCESSFNYSIKDGYLDCKLQNKLTSDENKAAQILLTTMYLGIQSIEESYASHVRILKEV